MAQELGGQGRIEGEGPALFGGVGGALLQDQPAQHQVAGQGEAITSPHPSQPAPEGRRGRHRCRQAQGFPHHQHQSKGKKAAGGWLVQAEGGQQESRANQQPPPRHHPVQRHGGHDGQSQGQGHRQRIEPVGQVFQGIRLAQQRQGRQGAPER